MADPQEIMELGFMVVYLIYILIIVIVMMKKRSSLDSEKRPAALRVLFGFSSLLIGDIGHVGAIIINFFLIEENLVITGIGTLFESIGLLFLFIFWIDAWRLEYSHSKNTIYYILIITGFIGLIIFIFPQNNWAGVPSSRFWAIIRNIPWLIQGIGISILILNDARKTDDKLMKIIGICIFSSFFFYMPVIFFGNTLPMLGMLMIPGTIIYMIWEFYSVKRFFPSN